MAKKPAVKAPAETGLQTSIITLKGSEAFKAWLAAESRRTHIPAATIVRLSLALWAEKQGSTPPPEK
jgi:hypothetical protein